MQYPSSASIPVIGLVLLRLLVPLEAASEAAGPVVEPLTAEGRARVPSLRAEDLVMLTERCGATEPVEESLELFRRHAAPSRRVREGSVLAFEEHPRFVYALAAPPARQRSGADDSGSRSPPRRIRRIFLLKPSTIVIEEQLRARRSAGTVEWRLSSTGEPDIEKRRFRIVEGGTIIAGEVLLPDNASIEKNTTDPREGRSAGQQLRVVPETPGETRMLLVFHLRDDSQKDLAALSRLTKGEDGQLELTVAANGKEFLLILPADPSRAGELEITDAEGEVLLPRRLLPSGVLPHGPEGTRLLERWDAPYRRDRTPGWDVGRPSSNLVKAVEAGHLKPGRAIVLGCGTGTNAIYLAGRGFTVTGVDIAPTALHLAQEKATKAGVQVQWLLADVLALPQMAPFDVIFDRGCYHHVRQYDAEGYVEATRRLSHEGTRILLLAGSDRRTGGGGPPRVKKEEIRDDFVDLFEFEWLRETRFDRPDGGSGGAPAWSALMRRKGD